MRLHGRVVVVVDANSTLDLLEAVESMDTKADTGDWQPCRPARDRLLDLGVPPDQHDMGGLLLFRDAALLRFHSHGMRQTYTQLTTVSVGGGRRALLIRRRVWG